MNSDYWKHKLNNICILMNHIPHILIVAYIVNKYES